MDKHPGNVFATWFKHDTVDLREIEHQIEYLPASKFIKTISEHSEVWLRAFLKTFGQLH